MGKGKHSKRPVKATPSRSETAVSNPISSRHRHELADAPSGRDRTARRCPSLGKCILQRFDPEALSRTERVMSIAEHPLADFARITSRWTAGGVDGAPPLSEKFITYLDQEPGPSMQRAQAILAALGRFARSHPSLYMLLVEHVDLDQSDRAIAAQLGLHHVTVGKMLRRARTLVQAAIPTDISI